MSHQPSLERSEAEAISPKVRVVEILSSGTRSEGSTTQVMRELPFSQQESQRVLSQSSAEI